MNEKDAEQVSIATLEHGKPTTVRPNRPVKFRMEFTGGSCVEGVIPPNSGLTVCNLGDVTRFDIVVDEDSLPGLDIVE